MTGVPIGCTQAAKRCGFEMDHLSSPLGDPWRSAAKRVFRMAGTLPKRQHASIKRLCAEGDELLEAANHSAALNKYREAWALVPDDKENWEASTWILSSAGEVYLQMRDYPAALNRFERAVQGPGGLGNSYIHLRLGQLYYETGNKDASADELTRAFMGAGEAIFAKEDPKYFEFLKTQLRPPPRGW